MGMMGNQENIDEAMNRKLMLHQVDKLVVADPPIGIVKTLDMGFAIHRLRPS
jgi:hypothetical protein